MACLARRDGLAERARRPPKSIKEKQQSKQNNKRKTNTHARRSFLLALDGKSGDGTDRDRTEGSANPRALESSSITRSGECPRAEIDRDE